MANGTTTAAPQKALTLLDSSMLIMGSMIGSGIFIVSAGMARDLQSPGLLLLAWLVTGLITVFGALSYGELAAAMPQAGGQYVYLKEAYNPMVAFSYGWTLFAVIQTGTIAAVGVAFAKLPAYSWKAFRPRTCCSRWGTSAFPRSSCWPSYASWPSLCSTSGA
jgi:APA family basic amino acid/polyamine antiporter